MRRSRIAKAALTHPRSNPYLSTRVRPSSLSSSSPLLLLRRNVRPARARTRYIIRPRLALRSLSSAPRTFATVRNVNIGDRGPIDEYNTRVETGRLRNDDHQRGIVESLQHLHEELRDYTSPEVIHPDIESLHPPKPSFLSALFHRKPQRQSTKIPAHLPKGLYLYGDVGSGKTMLMDMFYDTLPANITSKTRIHFHNFMQDVHKRLHVMKIAHGNDFDAIPFVAADIASQSSVLCFDEFQCTDVADAMILRRLLEALMSHGVVLVTTSNRAPCNLYKNGIQRASFLPCIALLNTRLHVLNLDSPTDYRKIPRPPSGVYHFPLDKASRPHAEKWFKFLGDFARDPPHTAVHNIWGRDVVVPRASGRVAWFTFDELIRRPTGAADYLELTRSYDAFVVSEIPGMTLRERDLARRFITFVDAVYESRAKLVLTSAVPLTQLFLSRDEVADALEKTSLKKVVVRGDEGQDVDDVMHGLVGDVGASEEVLRHSKLFDKGEGGNDEESFAFARALSRLSEMGSREWVERGMGLEHKGGKGEMEAWQRVRSRFREDSM